jgi:pimeloyl-ACP methyl ester carboxylesterase
MDPRPFTVHVPDDVLADLRDRLTRVRWPDQVPGAGWQFGTDPIYLRELIDYWRDGFDWRAQEAKLNSFRQFTVPIGGLDLHFSHQPGIGPSPLPLLVSHGWPGSVWEFHKIIPLLTDPARFGGDPADAFTVVAPSLPCYGFSFQANQPRLSRVEMVDAFATLMTGVLGYDRFGAQGGDIGASVTARLAEAYPDRLAGIHLNTVGFIRSVDPPPNPTPEEAEYRRDQQAWQTEEAGYQWIQGTKPQTLAYGLTDSPVGLAAWIVEKFRSWSDCGGDVERRFDKDELLTNVTIYWATGAINSSFWPYYSIRHGDWGPTAQTRIEVPTGFAAFPREISRPPRSIVERTFNIQRWTPMPAGGHFAALEEPAALAADIRAFFRPLRS